MITFPNAKINLGLHITSKRTDGYHEIDTCMYPIPWKDALEAVNSTEFKFSSSGLHINGELKDNLCFKAYQLLEKNYHAQPVHLHLHKEIPMGGGLGGGSSDAAFTLKLINDLQNLNISDSELEYLAAQLGSDCAFFIKNKPAISSGRGEILSKTSINLKGWFLVMVYPDTFVSTKEAYQDCIPEARSNKVEEIILQNPLEDWKELLTNDFEKWIFPKYPQLSQVKNQLYHLGASYASMTGSGATLFGLFKNPIEDIASHFPAAYRVFSSELP